MIKRAGAEVRDNINKKVVDMSKVAINLKENESIRVRLLGSTDYVEYSAHGLYSKKIYTQSCHGEDCPLCKAVTANVEGYEDLKAKSRYKFAMAGLDTGEIMVWDCSKNQARKLISQIEEYKEDLNEFAFNFKRTGSGKSTDYSLNLIPKMKADDKEKFDKFDGETVDIDFFEAVCKPKSADFIVRILKDAGFPVENVYDAELLAKIEENEAAAKDLTTDDTNEF